MSFSGIGWASVQLSDLFISLAFAALNASVEVDASSPPDPPPPPPQPNSAGRASAVKKPKTIREFRMNQAP
jgi:hypothetical protein